MGEKSPLPIECQGERIVRVKENHTRALGLSQPATAPRPKEPYKKFENAPVKINKIKMIPITPVTIPNQQRTLPCLTSPEPSRLFCISFRPAIPIQIAKGAVIPINRDRSPKYPEAIAYPDLPTGISIRVPALCLSAFRIGGGVEEEVSIIKQLT